MRHTILLIISTLSFFISQGQKINASDPKEWKYELFPGSDASIQDSTHMLGLVIFYSNYEIIEPVIDSDPKLLQRKSIRNARIYFHIFDIKDLTYCQDIARRIKDRSSCKGSQGAGDYFVAGKFVFMNLEDCFPCIIENNSKDMCKPYIESLFEKIENKENLSLTSLLDKLPIEKVIRY